MPVGNLSQIFQGFVAAQVKHPAPDGPAHGLQRFSTSRRQETVRVDTTVPHRLPCPECKSQEIKRRMSIVASPVRILAIDDLRLLGMQFQPAGCKAMPQRTAQRLRRLGALAVTNDVVRITLERDVRILPRHPHIERIVQKQICQQGANYPALRRPGPARYDTAIFHLNGHLQATLDVEQHPATVRMVTDGLEQQLPIDAVEVAFDVNVEHEVIPPAALTGLTHGIDRRSTGPVAIGIDMKHRFQTRLQVAADDFLSNAIGDRRNAQRARTAIGFWNIDPSHRQRKITPRRQSVPELVEVVRKISLKVRNRLPIYASRSPVGLHTLEGFPDVSLRDIERLCLVHRFLLSPVDQWPRLNNAAPLVQSHYRTFIPTTGCSAPVLRIGTLALVVVAT